MIDLRLGDCRTVLAGMPAESVHMVCTSPPYWGLRRYSGEQEQIWGGQPGCAHEWGVKLPSTAKHKAGETNPGLEGYSKDAGAWPTDSGQFCGLCGAWRGAFGNEPTPELYLAHTLEVLRAIRRVLRADGTVWWNCDDSRAGGGKGGGGSYASERPGWGGLPKGNKTRHPVIKPTNLCLIPQRLLIALQEDGWYVKSDIIWAKDSTMPESVKGWFFTKHRVTIEQYENMLHLQSNSSRRGIQSKKPSMSAMPEREGSVISPDRGLQAGQGTIPTIGEGQDDNTGSGGKARNKGETPSVQPLPARTSKPSPIRKNRKRQAKSESTYNPLQSDRQSQAQSTDTGQTATTKSSSQGKTEGISSSLSQDREGETSGSQKERSTLYLGDGYPESLDGSTMAGSSKGTQISLSLLPNEGKVDDRPCNSLEQRWEAREGQRSSSLPLLQLQETRQNRDALIDCPGCPKCAPNDGYVLRRGSGRPTDNYEHILVLSKTASYFWDSHGYREPLAESTLADGRNVRSVWRMNPDGYAGGHFAVFPSELPRRAIRLGTSAKGCCPTCAAPWARVVENGSIVQKGGAAKHDLAIDRNEIRQSIVAREVSTLGWRPTCEHPHTEADSVPAVVLDPFMGTATTLAVALELGRSAIGIDISEDYLRLAQKRLESTTRGMRV